MKKKLFGTDGIRGEANRYPITADVALQVGQAVARVLGTARSRRGRAVLGKDTRISGYMLEHAITSGLLSMGMDVLEVGPMPDAGGRSSDTIDGRRLRHHDYRESQSRRR